MNTDLEIIPNCKCLKCKLQKINYQKVKDILIRISVFILLLVLLNCTPIILLVKHIYYKENDPTFYYWWSIITFICNVLICLL